MAEFVNMYAKKRLRRTGVERYGIRCSECDFFKAAEGQGDGSRVKERTVVRGAEAERGEACADRGWGATGEAQV